MNRREQPEDSIARRGLAGWILLAGLALFSLGLVARSAQDETQDPIPGGFRYPISPGYGTADSNGSMIAVTGVDVTGGSLLYLIDSETRQLSVYQATGGTKSTMNIRWVGARNIDLDLQVDGFNDESEYTFKQLAAQFRQDGSLSEPNR